jgi:hypothetical protein
MGLKPAPYEDWQTIPPGISAKPAQRRGFLWLIVALDNLKASATWGKIPGKVMAVMAHS